MKLKPVNYFWLLFFLSVHSYYVKAQSVSAALELDTSTIVVGQQTIAKLRLTQPSGITIPWVQIPDTMKGIEIITKGSIDTLVTADKSKLTREQKFTITAFDSGYFVVTPFIFKYLGAGGKDTLTSETMAQLLTVNLMPVDTTKAIRDIKGPVEIGITWQEVLTWTLSGLLLIGIIFLLVYLIKRKKPETQLSIAPEPARPAHEIALEELEKLREEKLWQQGNYKFYYTRLSDVMRNYISLRWGFDAMEKTTDEIMHSAFSHLLTNANFSRLKSTLILSDLAKFAKYSPLGNENEQSMTDSFIFVNETKEDKRGESSGSDAPTTSNPNQQIA